MKIAHLISTPSHDGVATSSKMLAETQLTAGHEIMVVTRTNTWADLQKWPGSIVQMSSDFATKPGEIRKVGHALREWGAEIVHCHGSRGNKYGLVFRLASKTPIVATAHSCHVQLPWMFFSAVVAPSDDTATFHMRRNLVSRRKIHVIPHMLDWSDDPLKKISDREAVRAELGIGENEFVIGNVGTICERKNQVDALRVLRKIIDDGCDARLILVGGSPEDLETLPGWGELIKDPQIAERLILVGHRADAVRFFHAFDVFLFVSKQEEGPIVVLEAMAAGLPIVSYKVGDTSRQIEPSVTGYLVDQNDIDAAASGIVHFYHNPRMAKKFGIAAQVKLTAEFNPAQIGKRIEDVYRHVLSI